MGTLYLVATPIGNLEDVTLRALRVLREVVLIAAEDTRRTRQLLNHYGIPTRCISYHEHNRFTRLGEILAHLSEGDVALVADAGTPVLSDPGLELVQACIRAGYPVSPVPGPSAPIAALSAAGLPTEPFLFVGFFPRHRRDRRAMLEGIASLSASLVGFEAPHRLVEWLTDALEILGDRPLVLARELTKVHEEFLRGTIATALAHAQAHEPRGEYTLVVGGAVRPPAEAVDEAALRARLLELREQQCGGRVAARIVAQEFGLQSNLVYRHWLNLMAHQHLPDDPVVADNQHQDQKPHHRQGS